MGESIYVKSPNRKMIFDVKIMTVSLPSKSHGLMFGQASKTYSYLKIKRQMEAGIVFGSQEETHNVQDTVVDTATIKKQSVLIDKGVDTTPNFYRALDQRDPDFVVNTREQKFIANKDFGKTYDYVSLKRVRDNCVETQQNGTQIDEITLKKEAKKAMDGVLFSVAGVQRESNLIEKRQRNMRKPFNMPSKISLKNMWSMMPTFQINKCMQGAGLIGYCPNQYCKNYQKIDMYPLGFGKFNFPDLHTLTICELCPLKAMNPQSIVLLGLWFKDCRYEVTKNPNKFDFLRIEEIQSIFPEDFCKEKKIRGIHKIPIGDSIFGVGVIDGVKPSKSKLARMKKEGVINDFKKGEGLVLCVGKLNSYDYEDKEIQWDARDKRYVDNLNEKGYKYKVV